MKKLNRVKEIILQERDLVKELKTSYQNRRKEILLRILRGHGFGSLEKWESKPLLVNRSRKIVVKVGYRAEKEIYNAIPDCCVSTIFIEVNPDSYYRYILIQPFVEILSRQDNTAFFEKVRREYDKNYIKNLYPDLHGFNVGRHNGKKVLVDW